MENGKRFLIPKIYKFKLKRRNMEKQIKILFGALFMLVLTLSLTSAMVVKSVDANNFQPGSEQEITIEVKNTLDEDATDVSLTFDISSNTPFTLIDSEDTKEIDKGDTEDFDFKIKALSDATAGDYPIHYKIDYSNSTGPQTAKEGDFVLTIEAEPQLVYSISAENPLIGSQGKLTLKINNKGLGDARFVSITLLPSKYTLLSNGNVYVGTVSSDDSQTENFEVIFNQQNPILNAQVEYRNFNNELITETIALPITVYTQEQALKLGIIKPNNSPVYIGAAILIIAGWVIVRKIRKKRRLNKAQGR